MGCCMQSVLQEKDLSHWKMCVLWKQGHLPEKRDLKKERLSCREERPLLASYQRKNLRRGACSTIADDALQCQFKS